jgi:hypothetical protein
LRTVLRLIPPYHERPAELKFRSGGFDPGCSTTAPHRDTRFGHPFAHALAIASPLSCTVVDVTRFSREQPVKRSTHRSQRDFPSPNLLDHGLRVGGPDKRLRVVVGFGQIPIDGGLEIDDAFEDAALEPLLG